MSRRVRGTLLLSALCYLACGAAAEETPPPVPPPPPPAESAPRQPAAFDAARAWQHLTALVAQGPRPPDSAGSADVRAYIRAQWAAAGLPVQEQVFIAHTPAGEVDMTNIWAERAGAGEDVLVISAHYDTKIIAGVPEFVGANDSAGGVAVLLALAEALRDDPPPLTVWFVCYDGEEAYARWSDTDGIYGSRAFVKHLTAGGQLSRVAAAINLDMIGDEHLRILREVRSTSQLQDRVWATAAALGHGLHFTEERRPVTDDHVPFLRAGIPALNLIDFRYGPRSQDNRWWHSRHDTPAHCRPESLGIVGDVILATIRSWPPSDE